jgi:archaellum biogenesis ATPase FlaH
MLKPKSIKDYKEMFKNRQQSFIIDGLIENNSLSLLVGPSNVGKTWVSYYLSHCVVDGKPFLNRKCEQGTVLYFDKEMSDYQSYVRSGKFNYMNDDCFLHFTEDFPDVLNDKEVEQFLIDVEEYVKNHNAKLLVIDSLNACCSTLDENSNTHMRQFMTFAKRLKNIITTVIIHHKGKAENSEFRGASVIKDSCDNFFSVDKRGELSVIKQRFSNGKSFKISYDFEETDTSVTFTLKDDNSTDIDDISKLSNLILENLEDGMNQSELFKKMRDKGIRFVNIEVRNILKNMSNVRMEKGENNANIYYLNS